MRVISNIQPAVGQNVGQKNRTLFDAVCASVGTKSRALVIVALWCAAWSAHANPVDNRNVTVDVRVPYTGFLYNQWSIEWAGARARTEAQLQQMGVFHKGKSKRHQDMQQLALVHADQMQLLERALPHAEKPLLIEGYVTLFGMHAQWFEYMDMEQTPQLMDSEPYRVFVSRWSALERTWGARMRTTVTSQQFYEPFATHFITSELYQNALYQTHPILWSQYANALSALTWMKQAKTGPLKNAQYAFTVDQCRDLGAHWGMSIKAYVQQGMQQMKNPQLYSAEEVLFVQTLASNRALSTQQCDDASTQGAMMRKVYTSKVWTVPAK